MKIVQCWDDGVVEDIRLIKILRRFGAKASFNLNFGLHKEHRSTTWKYLGTKEVWRLAKSELRDVYDGFLVANHCYTHAPLGRVAPDIGEREVRDGRDALEQHFGTPVTGFAYPGGSYNPAAEELVRAAGHIYARTIRMVDKVFPPENPMAFHPHCDFKDPRFREKFERARQADDVFYFMGHSYEIMTESDWQAFEDQIAWLADEGVTWVDLPDLFTEQPDTECVAQNSPRHNSP